MPCALDPPWTSGPTVPVWRQGQVTSIGSITGSSPRGSAPKPVPLYPFYHWRSHGHKSTKGNGRLLPEERHKAFSYKQIGAKQSRPPTPFSDWKRLPSFARCADSTHWAWDGSSWDAEDSRRDLSGTRNHSQSAASRPTRRLHLPPKKPQGAHRLKIRRRKRGGGGLKSLASNTPPFATFRTRSRAWRGLRMRSSSYQCRTRRVSGRRYWPAGSRTGTSPSLPPGQRITISTPSRLSMIGKNSVTSSSERRAMSAAISAGVLPLMPHTSIGASSATLTVMGNSRQIHSSLHSMVFAP